MGTSGEKEAIDDYMEWLRLSKSRRLLKEMFTSEQLVDLAHQSGFSFVNGQMLRNWTRRDVFRPA